MISQHHNIFTLRVKIKDVKGNLGSLLSRMSLAGALVQSVDMIGIAKGYVTRDITISASDEQHFQEILKIIKEFKDVKVVNVSDNVTIAHLGGKLQITGRKPLKNRMDLSIMYTPGVARISSTIYKDPERVFSLTMKGNTVAIVTDGTRVLGLGDIGPEAALPVMEGKAQIFYEFAGIYAMPICLNTKDAEEIIKTVKYIAPVFGGINLEDISSPKCFEITDRLTEELDIPVFHDDQDGTAISVLIALTNALRLKNERFANITVAISGAGAAGTATAKILIGAGVKNIIICDRAGTLYAGRKENMNNIKQWLSENTNHERRRGTISDALNGTNVFIGLSGPSLVKRDDIERMAKDPIVFALANPVPEIMPEEIRDLAPIIGTGRSDYPNQINNALVFPGIFRGALDCHAKRINTEMKLAAANAAANIISKRELREEYIVPSVFDKRVARKVARAVIDAARKTGVAQRKEKPPHY